MIPNTTPTPNELFNGEMKKMSDTELRVVLIVTRSTFGWEVDHETGMRKKEDWITRSQIEQKAGRGHSSVSGAIDGCVKKGWIETRDEDGKVLKTPAERRHKKIFYRLGKVFLSKSPPCPESGLAKSGHNKRNCLTKEKLSPIQEIVCFYKKIKNFNEIANWDEHHFARAGKSAKAILEQAGDIKQALICMKEIGEYCERKKLFWTIETIVKKFPEWKTGKLKPISQSQPKTFDTFVPFNKRPGYQPLTKKTMKKGIPWGRKKQG